MKRLSIISSVFWGNWHLPDELDGGVRNFERRYEAFRFSGHPTWKEGDAQEWRRLCLELDVRDLEVVPALRGVQAGTLVRVARRRF